MFIHRSFNNKYTYTSFQKASFVPILRSLLAQLPIFDEYFVNSNVGIVRCQSLADHDARFRKFLAKHSQHGQLTALLEAPILRTCRYPALINQLVKHAPTRAYASEIGALSATLETWVEDHARQNRQDAIGYEQLRRVSACIDGLDAAVPGRAFIHEGDVLLRTGVGAATSAGGGANVTSASTTSLSSSNNSSSNSALNASASTTKETPLKPTHLFLFNDVLVVTTPKTFAKRRFDFKFHVLLDAMTEVRALPSDSAPSRYWLRLRKVSAKCVCVCLLVFIVS